MHTSDPGQCGYSNELHWTHLLALGGHAFFVLLHLLQTHLWYDGIALDNSEFSSILSAALYLSLVLFMENGERGFIFGGCRFSLGLRYRGVLRDGRQRDPRPA